MKANAAHEGAAVQLGRISISEPAGGVARWLGERLLPDHRLGEQSPGDGPQSEAVMSMTEREPQTLVRFAFADHRDHVGKTRTPAHPGLRLQPFGERKQFARHRLIAR